MPIIAAGICTVFLARTAGAEGRGMAVVFTCTSLETEFEDGSIVEAEYRAHFVQTEHFGSTNQPVDPESFVMGPMIPDAGGGIFNKVEPIFASSSSRSEILAKAQNADLQHYWVTIDTPRVPVGSAGQLFYVRPATEVARSRSGLSVTEFNCSQVQF